MKRAVVWLLIGAMLVAGCAPAAAPAPAGKALTKIRVPMGYIANVQYAPFYVAADKGYFAEEGLDIEFDYRYETDGMKLVGAGELPFAVVSGEQVPLARAQGLPVVYVMHWWQKFAVAVASLADKNIKTPADLVGKSVGLPGFFGASYIGWRGLLEQAGLKESDVKVQDIGFTQAAALQQGKVDAAVVYINNEPIQLRAAGLDVNVIPVSDYLSLVANGIITNEKTIQENPQLVRSFVRALLRGLKDALDDPDWLSIPPRSMWKAWVVIRRRMRSSGRFWPRRSSCGRRPCWAAQTRPCGIRRSRCSSTWGCSRRRFPTSSCSPIDLWTKRSENWKTCQAGQPLREPPGSSCPT